MPYSLLHRKTAKKPYYPKSMELPAVPKQAGQATMLDILFYYDDYDEMEDSKKKSTDGWVKEKGFAGSSQKHPMCMTENRK